MNDIRPMGRVRVPMGSLRAGEETFICLISRKNGIFRADRSDRSRKCRECEYKAVCMGDSAHTWNYVENEPDCCVAAMLREEKEQ